MSGLAEVLLDRLDKVRGNGDRRWLACCPAHDDRSPSLSVRERDGRVLVHCFAGCEARAVLEAVGLQWRDLFEGSLSDSARAEYAARGRRERARRAQMTTLVGRLSGHFRDAPLAPEHAAEIAAAERVLEASGAGWVDPRTGEVVAPPARSVLPVGGPLLWARRMAGQHPSPVWVMAGGDGSRPPRAAALLCVRDATPAGALDWRVVAGLAVHVLPRGHAWVPSLVVDMAAFGAPVVVHQDGQTDAADYAPAALWPDGALEDYRARCRRAAALEIADEHYRRAAKGEKGARRFADDIVRAVS